LAYAYAGSNPASSTSKKFDSADKQGCLGKGIHALIFGLARIGVAMRSMRE
jgi:hypothetical protein